VPVSIRELTAADDARRAELVTFAAAGTPVTLTVADQRDQRRCFPWRGCYLARHLEWRMELDRAKSLADVARPC
jgi:hypothetical protein